jgi:ABC-2 type transport system permease protein
MTETRPMFWSVRRELWENRSIFIAPLAVAAVMPFGFLISAIGMPQRRRAVLLLDPVQQRALIGKPYDIAAMILIVTAFIVAVFYCLDALHGERRDRSILFWKSLPVSDRTTVLAKATIPLVVMPAIIFAIIVVTQFIMLLLSSLVLLQSGLAGTTWTRFNLIQQSLILLYGLIALSLWHAPIYGWMLMVSSWARRATFLWAVLPFFAIAMFERIALGSSRFGLMLRSRVIGFAAEAFAPNKYGSIDTLAQLTPGRFLSTPGLWIGLILAAIFLAAATRLRRNREPI